MGIDQRFFVDVGTTPQSPLDAGLLAAATKAGAIAGDEAGRISGAAAGAQAAADIATEIATGAVAGAIAAIDAQTALSITAVQNQQATSVTAVQDQQSTSVVAVQAQQTLSVDAVADQQALSVAAVVTQQGLSVTAVEDAAVPAIAAADAAALSAAAAEADRIQAGLDAGISTAQAVISTTQAGISTAQAVISTAQAGQAITARAGAETAESNAEGFALAAAADANTYYLSVAAGVAATVDGDQFYVATEAGVQVWENQVGVGVFITWLNKIAFTTVATLLASTVDLGPVGNIVEAQGFRYQVVASGEHVTTAGGEKLIVLPDADGYFIEAFGADMTGSASANAVATVANATALAAGVPLVIANGTIRLTATFTFTAVLDVRAGGIINRDTGVVCQVNNRFTAGRYSVFTGLGTTTFGANSVDEIYVEWFGAKSRASNASPFDSYPGIFAALTAASQSLLGNNYKVTLGQGVYDVATEISIPTGGLFSFHGQGLSTQLRPMNGGAGWPVAVMSFTTSTVESRVSKMHLFGGSVSRPTDWGIRANFEMKHTHMTEMFFTYFAKAGVLSADWDVAITRTEFVSCGVGVWLGANTNNNEITLDIVRCISCTVGIATGPGANVRITNGQQQGALAAPFTQTHIYVYRGNCVTIENIYCETQSSGGLAGMAFTTPEAAKVYADIIFNDQPYYTDIAGTAVTTTLSQSASNVGSVAEVVSCLFASPSYWLAGAGGSGYTAGAVTLVAAGGSGSGASGTASVSSGAVSNITSITGGTDWQVGDWFTITQGGNTSGHGTVTAVTTNNAISTIQIGGAAGIYPGSCRSLYVQSCVFGASILALYNDPAVCQPGRVVIDQCARAPSGPDFILLGSDQVTQKVRFSALHIDNLGYERLSNGVNANLSVRNYYPNSFTFTPTVSTFARQATFYQGVPEYRLTLNASQQTSDAVSGTLTVASSGAVNSELVNRRVYLSVAKSESTSNVKLRLTLSVTSGTSTVTRQNYDTSTSFTKTAGVGREEVSIMVPPAGGTVTWTIEVIAATAASQFVALLGCPTLTLVGWSTENFPRLGVVQPLIASTTWDPALIAPGGFEEKDVTVNGARFGDPVMVGLPYSPDGMSFSARTSAANTVRLRWDNPPGATSKNPSNGTYNLQVGISG